MTYTKKYQVPGYVSKVSKPNENPGLKETWDLGYLNPYNYTRPSGTSVFGALFSGKVRRIPEIKSTDDKDEAFGLAHAKLGAGKTFLHKGVRYKTDHAGETEHVGTNYFFANMEKAVEDGSEDITQERLDNLKTLWTELGQPNLEVGDDKWDHILTGKSWDELGLDKSDHVNPITDKVFIKAYKTDYPEYWMDAVINELTHVKQQRDMGRLSYMGKYVKDLIMSKGDQYELYGTEGTLEHGAHGEIYDNMKNFVETGERTKKHKYGGYINTSNLTRKYQETSTWDNFKKSDVGRFVDARGFERMFGMEQGIGGTIGKHFGYDSDEGKDLALDATAIINPAADFVHAGTKFDEGEYTDAALYAGFALLPGAAGPLVKGTKGAINKVKNFFSSGPAKIAGETATHTYNPATKQWVDKSANAVKTKILANNINEIKTVDYYQNTVVKLEQQQIHIVNDIAKWQKANPGVKVPQDLIKSRNIANSKVINYNNQLNKVLKDGSGNMMSEKLVKELEVADKLDLERIVGDYKWDDRNIISKYFNTPTPPK